MSIIRFNVFHFIFSFHFPVSTFVFLLLESSFSFNFQYLLALEHGSRKQALYVAANSISGMSHKFIQRKIEMSRTMQFSDHDCFNLFA